MSLLAEKAPTRTYAAHAKPWWQRTLMTRDSAIIALLVVVWLYASIAILNFSDPITVYFLVLDIAPILLIALPMTLIIITGEIDLSVASSREIGRASCRERV